jgi:predicted RND superfamily exporter protein
LLTVVGGLLSDLMRSFGMAFIAITLMVIALLRDVKLGLIAMVPNLLPIVMMLGGMAVFEIPLDIVTVMVASVNLGIVVDDTIHVLHAFRAEREASEVGEAVLRAVRRTGRAVVTTSIVLALGFSTLALSNFQPTAHFGALTAVTMAFALFADLLLLPALLVVGARIPGLHDVVVAGEVT